MPKLSPLRLSPQEFRTALGARIRVLRTHQNISQEKMGKDLHTSQSAVARIEAGQCDCSIHKIHHIATVLNTNITHLLEGLL
jgi:transcriptional regulator with XRE-family HTH domain